jgi:hypothetical protein
VLRTAPRKKFVTAQITSEDFQDRLTKAIEASRKVINSRERMKVITQQVEAGPEHLPLMRELSWMLRLDNAMSGPGQTRTSADVCDMTASPPRADMTESPRGVAEGPMHNTGSRHIGFLIC